MFKGRFMVLQSLCLAAVLTVLAGCSTVPITGRRQLSLVSNSELAAMAVTSYSTLLKEAKLSTDTAKVATLRRVGARIQASAETFMRESGRQSELADYKWEFNLIQDDKTVNAFCMPGGKVAFYTGIWPVCKDEAGIAVVMGHEVAHALANHGNERMSQQMLLQMGGEALAVALKEKPQQTQNIFLSVFGLGSELGVMLPFSRSHESEADHIGLILMARAGYDPAQSVPFWERMAAAGGGQTLEFLSTHPAPATRISDLKKELPEAEKYYTK